ncbi:hypothetical protein [Streptomyces sp. H27-C3]|uniref:hypothetical protein n=1 Tax=Streptomyces sp. H27-C3 TaxID=3046305 RepID=UPI0024B9028C|nr:hypothetical protein [Streptomyces sp. H27-C3]MDJ0466149.1 hypothetical protein [Streptomyces sp. H27-C3]
MRPDTQPRPAPSRSAAGLAARLAVQATALREALRRREQRDAAGGPEHDHGLHNLANRLLAIVAADVVPEQPPADDTVARLVRDAEPLREALLLREDDATAAAVRDVDWELHSLAYRVLTVVELLEVNYPHVTPAGSRSPFRPISDLIADAVATWPEEQRVRVAAELARAGVELPQARDAAVLRPGTSG